MIFFRIGRFGAFEKKWYSPTLARRGGGTPPNWMAHHNVSFNLVVYHQPVGEGGALSLFFSNAPNRSIRKNIMFLKNRFFRSFLHLSLSFSHPVQFGSLLDSNHLHSQEPPFTDGWLALAPHVRLTTSKLSLSYFSWDSCSTWIETTLPLGFEPGTIRSKNEGLLHSATAPVHDAGLLAS